MNFKLAREIYGNNTWMIDPMSFSGLFGILNQLRNGDALDVNEGDKLNSISSLSISSRTKLAFNEYQLRKADDDDEIVSIVNLDGPITKNGGMSSYGMRDLANNMNIMSRDNRVKGHVLVTDSGGGSSNAVVFMRDAIKLSQSLGKPVVQLVEKGGLNASAAYYIGSFSNYIYSESKDNFIGSIGTMVELAGYPKQHKRKSDGAIFVRAYATKSINKNKGFEEALKGNLKPITSDLLDPHNEKFLNDVMSNRPNITKEQLEGDIFQAKDVVGTLIDEIGTLENAVDKVMQLSKELKTTETNTNTSTNINNKNKTMTKAELKSAHPKVYNEILADGAIQKADQVGAWMAHADTDIKAVRKGIDSGKDISQSEREAFFVKQNSKSTVEEIIDESAQEIVTDESKGGEKTKKTKAQVELDAAFNFDLN